MSKYLLLACIFLGSTGLTAASPPSAADATVTTPAQRPARRSGYANPIVRLDPSGLRRFDSALSSLSRQAQVAIICEGQPLRLELPEAQVKKIAGQVGLPGTPLEEALEQVAAAFDYDAVRTGAATFLLTKRYSDPDDLPDVTFEEVTGSLQNILRAARNFSPALSRENAIRALLRSSSDGQRERLARGIPVSELPPSQRQMAWQFACSFELGAFGLLEDVAKVAQRLRGCRSPRARFTRRQYWNLTLPAYEGPFGIRGAVGSVALSRWVYTQSGGGTIFEGPPGVELVDGETRIVSKNRLADPTTPRPGERVVRPPSSSLKRSLGEVVGRINERLAPGNANTNADTASAVKVDPSLSAKAVCLAGDELLPPEALLEAIAGVYGLQVRRANGGTARITQPSPRILTNADAVGAEIRRLLPAPFLRAVTDAAGAQDAQGGFSDARGSAVYVASVRRLREIVEPKIEKRDDQKLPLLEAGDEARDLVALSSLATCLFAFQQLARPKPSYVTDFSRATLSLSPSKGNPDEIEFTIKSVDDQGKGSAVAGSVTFPPSPSRTRSPRGSNPRGQKAGPN